MSGESCYFCPNPDCINSAANRQGHCIEVNLSPGSGKPKCNQCGLELIEAKDKDKVPTAQARRPAGTLALAMTRLPYGEYQLAFGDDDATQTYEGKVRPGKNHYVFELKVDLMRLGYYEPFGRFMAEEEWGKFHWHLAGAVLALKWDLHFRYGVEIDTRKTLYTEKPKKLEAKGKIIYDNSLAYPGESQAAFTKFAAIIAGTKVDQKSKRVYISIESFLKSITAQLKTACTKQAQPKSRTLKLDLTLPIKGACQRIAGATKGLDKILNRKELGQAKQPDYQSELKSLCQDAAETSEKGSSTLGNSTSSYQSGTKFSAVKLEKIVPDKVENNIASLQQFLVETNNRLVQLDHALDGINWIRLDIRKLKESTAESGNAAEGSDKLREKILKNRQSHLEALIKLRNDLYICLRKTQVLVERLNTFYQTKAPEAGTYEEQLKHYSAVDWETALYIKHMIGVDAPLKGKGVFRVPINDELTVKEDKTFVQILRESTQEFTSGHGDTVPDKLIVSVMGHESGGKHVINAWRPWADNHLGIKRIVLMGVDWSNTGGKHVFDAERTRTVPVKGDPNRSWAYSRGWGGSQYTPRQETVDGFKHWAGLPFDDKKTGKRPKVKYASDAEWNTKRGVKLLREKFDGDTREKRSCTYSPKYDCHNCIRRLSMENLVPLASGQGQKIEYKLSNCVSFGLTKNAYDLTIKSTKEFDFSDKKSATSGTTSTQLKPFLPAIAKALLDEKVHLESTQQKQLEALAEPPDPKTVATRKLGLRLFSRSSNQDTERGTDAKTLFDQIAKDTSQSVSIELKLRLWLSRTMIIQRAKKVVVTGHGVLLQSIRIEKLTQSTKKPPFYPSSEAGSGTGFIREYPCSWLCAIIRYAGAGPLAFNYLKKHISYLRNRWVLPEIVYKGTYEAFVQEVITATKTLTTDSNSTFPVKSENISLLIRTSNAKNVYKMLKGLKPAPTADSSKFPAILALKKGEDGSDAVLIV